eukprot:362632-Pyramimonas_sp.AAC.1
MLLNDGSHCLLGLFGTLCEYLKFESPIGILVFNLRRLNWDQIDQIDPDKSANQKTEEEGIHEDSHFSNSHFSPSTLHHLANMSGRGKGGK